MPGIEQNEDEEQDEDDGKSENKPDRARKTSGPKALDPYASDESSLLLPVLVALGVFIPTLFCLCKLCSGVRLIILGNWIVLKGLNV